MYGPVDLGFFTGGTATNDVESAADSLDDGTFTKVTIKARDTLTIPLTVLKHDSQISWKFRTDNYDIGFQILYQADGQVVLPFSRIQTTQQSKRASFKKKAEKDNQVQQKNLEEGSLPCSRLLGTYQVIFDNSYSWTRAKTVYYSLSVIEP